MEQPPINVMHIHNYIESKLIQTKNSKVLQKKKLINKSRKWSPSLVIVVVEEMELDFTGYWMNIF